MEGKMGHLNMVFVRAQNAWFAARDEETGQTLVEYALIIALVAIAAIAALGFLSGRIQALFSDAGSSLDNAA
jgi:Flp pilus assembly pilin Flp